MPMYGLDKLGQGVMEGLQLGRQWDRQDERDRLRREQASRAEEKHALSMETGEAQLDQYDREAAAYEQEQALNEWKSGANIALMAAERGDLDAVESWIQQHPQYGNIVIDTEGENGPEMVVMPSDPASDTVLTRPIEGEQDLANIVRQLAGMEQPEGTYGEPFEYRGGVFQYGPDGKLESVEGLTPEDLGGGAEGKEGLKFTDEKRFFDRANAEVSRIMSTYLGEQFMGDPNAADLQSAANDAAYRVIKRLRVKNPHNYDIAPEAVGNQAITMLLRDPQYKNANLTNAKRQARMEMSGATEEQIEARAREIQEDVLEDFRADFMRAFKVREGSAQGQGLNLSPEQARDYAGAVSRQVGLDTYQPNFGFGGGQSAFAPSPEQSAAAREPAPTGQSGLTVPEDPAPAEQPVEQPAERSAKTAKPAPQSGGDPISRYVDEPPHSSDGRFSGRRLPPEARALFQVMAKGGQPTAAQIKAAAEHYTRFPDQWTPEGEQLISSLLGIQ